MVFKVPSYQAHSMTPMFLYYLRSSYTFIIKGSYFNFSMIFCFSLVVMSALGHKSVILGEYGAQSLGDERAVYSNTAGH